jgi:hypothetical protein
MCFVFDEALQVGDVALQVDVSGERGGVGIPLAFFRVLGFKFF